MCIRDRSYTDIKWSSNNSKITVDQNGLVQISGVILASNYSAEITCTITLSAVSYTHLDFEITGADTVREGTEIQLSIDNVQPEAADTSDITWTSSDPSKMCIRDRSNPVPRLLLSSSEEALLQVYLQMKRSGRPNL